jgi:Ni,Fe-hydrogenase III large subunit
MKGIIGFEMRENPGRVKTDDIPVLDYDVFARQVISMLKKESCHCVNYFAAPSGGGYRFFIIMANDDTRGIYLFSHYQPAGTLSLESITRERGQLHFFEREIHEKTGIIFANHTWLKPVRYSHSRSDRNSRIADHDFYRISGDELHEVGVGPIHAGIIEPGYFRFICHGERVLHLEIQLGYQHRGIEELFLEKDHLLQRSLLSESIAGDTAIGHGIAFALAAEALSGANIGERLLVERCIALEIERVAMHLGDLAALCGDVAYQTGQVALEALRTIVINAMQDWCGNRFGKGLIRTMGTNFPLTDETTDTILSRLSEVIARYIEVTNLVFNDSGVISRFENTGIVTRSQALQTGAVGMAARASGLARDTRASHPFLPYPGDPFKPATRQGGDVYARALIRKTETLNSVKYIRQLVSRLKTLDERSCSRPDYSLVPEPASLSVSLVEGWRGEICHSAITDESGNIVVYKARDPSTVNWLMLALAARGQEISDFPLCNKSFNLSYCGNDL